ncbi:HAD-IIIA family hydrolase [Candidatus Sumerlaeota bacterium]|nr:HAD-IIIA family hydrolase [Candidatus Sumerlaeota bacterium]
MNETNGLGGLYRVDGADAEENRSPVESASSAPSTLFSPIHLIVFDLDGTLVDTFDDIAAAANYALREAGLPTLPVALVKSKVGFGARVLMRRLMGGDREIPEEAVDRAYDSWRRYYADHATDFSRCYEGVRETLALLQQRGIALGVLSNKFHDLTVRIVANLGLAKYFMAVYGESDSHPTKPDPAMLRRIMEQAGVSPLQTLVVGDGEADMRVAENAGVAALGVRYGVHPPERLLELGAAAILDRIDQLPALLG